MPEYSHQQRTTSNEALLLVAVNDAAAVQIVRAELNGDAITGKNAYEVLAHAPGYMGQSLMPLLLRRGHEITVWCGMAPGTIAKTFV